MEQIICKVSTNPVVISTQREALKRDKFRIEFLEVLNVYTQANLFYTKEHF
jgi:hypothetical protein